MVRQPHTATSEELARLVQKGTWLHAMIRADADGALQLMKQDRRYEHKDSSQSKWTDPRALRDNGWESGRFNAMWHTRGVNDVLEDLNLPQSSTDKDVKIKNEAGGEYAQVIKIRDGLIMPYWIWSPAEEAHHNRRADPRVPLHSYSDVLFLEYKKMADRAHVSPRNIKYILFHNVENTKTWAAVLKIFDRRGKLRRRSRNQPPELQLRSWPGERLSMRSDRDQVLAMLATPLGATVAWLLIQHKHYFAGKDIRSVHIFKNRHADNWDTNHPKPSVLFTIESL